MKLKSSIIAIAALSSMSFAGGDIGGPTTFETGDYVAAEVAAEVAGDEQYVAPAVAEVTRPPVVVIDNTKKEEKKEEKKVVPPVVASAGNFYAGIAASLMAVRLDDRVNLFADENQQDRQIGITALIGYDFMDYLGAELRASMAVSGEDNNNDALQQVGVYLKPNYHVDDIDINLYGLLGYSMINMSDVGLFDGDNSGFSFGAGLDYGVTENISVFTDVVNYLRNYGGTNSTWGANLGLKYNF